MLVAAQTGSFQARFQIQSNGLYIGCNETEVYIQLQECNLWFLSVKGEKLL